MCTKVKCIKPVLAATMLFSSSMASAFDGNRTGFLLSVGAGLQTVGIEELEHSSVGGSTSKTGLSTSLKIGGGFTDQFSLYYVRNASWFDSQVGVEDSYVFITGISGVGSTFYMKPTAPSAYVLGAVGVGDLAAPFATRISVDVGSAYMFGVGYEFSSHNAIEATMVSVNLNDVDFDNRSASLDTFQVTYNRHWY